MPSLFAADALLPSGWARDVLLEWDEAGTLRRVETGRSAFTRSTADAAPFDSLDSDVSAGGGQDAVRAMRRRNVPHARRLALSVVRLQDRLLWLVEQSPGPVGD